MMFIAALLAAILGAILFPDQTIAILVILFYIFIMLVLAVIALVALNL